jgi:multicomponent Na+:H+ antiporter subunit E
MPAGKAHTTVPAMTRLLLLNILLALLWTFVWGSFNIYTLAAGFILGYLLLGLYSRLTAAEGYGLKVWHLLSFVFYFVRILIKANIQIAIEVLTPIHYQSPRIIRYDVSGLTDVQITTLANAISLTPGTLSMDISEDRHWLYIHSMYAADRAAAEAEIDALRRRLIREVF